MIGFTIFLLGLAVGSFLNVLIWRTPQKKKITRARSQCLHCGTKLAWYDLFPIISYIFLAGRCRYCKKAISPQYPLVELASGLLFLLVAWKFPHQFIDLIFWLYISALFLLISVFDLRYKLISTKMLAFTLGGGIFYRALPLIAMFFGISLPPSQTSQTFQTFLFSGFLTGGLILFLVFLTNQKGMGMGDVPVAFLQGLLLGYPDGLLALFISFIIGAAVGIGLIVSGKAALKSQIPFAPFLIVSLFIVLFARA